ncbi:protogenin A-like [Misgurnus anguillicaudatus]|uniref:protogenin A-like n=1 Tax=Misgurnus anguillicaudatus TaxID=75329 RepID=UPI003CCF32E7
MASFQKELYQRLLFFVVFLQTSGVLGFSELFFMKEPHDVTILRKDAVLMDCQAHGEAPIAIRWLKNGAKLTETEHVYQLTNGSLFISDSESRKDKSNEGIYQCLAQNKYGSILSQRARLTIASKFY